MFIMILVSNQRALQHVKRRVKATRRWNRKIFPFWWMSANLYSFFISRLATPIPQQCKYTVMMFWEFPSDGARFISQRRPDRSAFQKKQKKGDSWGRSNCIISNKRQQIFIIKCFLWVRRTWSFFLSGKLHAKRFFFVSERKTPKNEN